MDRGSRVGAPAPASGADRLPTVAAITMVRNEAVMLPRWVRPDNGVPPR